jgi:pimeloyl-ACP methyl ester carboxylesterase
VKLVLIPILNEVFATLGATAEGAAYSIVCAEEVGFYTAAEAEAAARETPRTGGSWRTDVVTGIPLFAVCDGWNVPTSPAVEEEPVVSEAPALVLAGEYDPITPPAYGQVAVETLANGQYVEFPGLPHAVSAQSPCASGIAASFVDAPLNAVDAACVAELSGPVFVGV